MKELNTIKNIVMHILQEVPESRNSDNVLYKAVIARLSAQHHENYGEMPITVFLDNMNDWGLPSIETVSRCRRKVQQENPELRADETVKKFRSDKEAFFKEFARG